MTGRKARTDLCGFRRIFGSRVGVSDSYGGPVLVAVALSYSITNSSYSHVGMA